MNSHIIALPLYENKKKYPAHPIVGSLQPAISSETLKPQSVQENGHFLFFILQSTISIPYLCFVWTWQAPNVPPVQGWTPFPGIQILEVIFASYVA